MSSSSAFAVQTAVTHPHGRNDLSMRIMELWLLGSFRTICSGILTNPCTRWHCLHKCADDASNQQQPCWSEELASIIFHDGKLILMLNDYRCFRDAVFDGSESGPGPLPATCYLLLLMESINHFVRKLKTHRRHLNELSDLEMLL